MAAFVIVGTQIHISTLFPCDDDRGGRSRRRAGAREPGTSLSKVLAVIAFLLLAWLVLRRARLAFLESRRGQEVRAVWRLLRQLGAMTGGGGRPYTGAAPSRDRTPGAAAGSRAVVLVRCAACGTHVPEEKARRDAGGVYCSEACEHRASR
jgi:hypothetical protein